MKKTLPLKHMRLSDFIFLYLLKFGRKFSKREYYKYLSFLFFTRDQATEILNLLKHLGLVKINRGVIKLKHPCEVYEIRTRNSRNK